MKLNKERVEQLQSGKVVLYTGDKKGSDEVCNLLFNAGAGDFYNRNRAFFPETISLGCQNFYGYCDEDKEVQSLSSLSLYNRPIHPIEWFYEEELTEKGKALKWYLKGFYDAETTESQPVSIEQTMKDAETHFYLQYNK